MKKREEGFLGTDKIDHEGEIFDYIKELHEYLWRFVRVIYPNAGGDLDNFLDEVLEIADVRMIDRHELIKKFMMDKDMKHKEVMEKWLDVYAGEKDV